ncbi:hypothetical protein AAHC03_013517 [Spirometra sp. Aus1]
MSVQSVNMERFEASAVFLSYSLIMLVLSIIMSIIRKFILKKFGIAGPVWYSTTATFPSILFAILFTQFRRRAPGARTFLQVSHARFGKTAHMVLCVFALLNNFSILALVISSGSRVFSGITTHISFELVWIITVIVSGICASAGSIRQSLPTMVVVSFLLMVCTLATLVAAFFVDLGSGLGSLDRIYEVVSQDHSVAANYEGSRLTFRSLKPIQSGVRRFLSMAPITVFEELFGRSGVLLLFAMNAYIMVTVGVFQIFSISSILTVDIFSTHIKPFRVCYDTNCCLLCGKTRDMIARPKDKCECCPVGACEQCQHDIGARNNAAGPAKLMYNCRVHTDFRNYERRLENVNGTAILLILGGMLPVGLFLNYPGVSVMYTLGICTTVWVILNLMPGVCSIVSSESRRLK